MNQNELPSEATNGNGRRLEKKKALIVGAGSSGPGWGNGKAAAVLFARQGASVFCVDINKESADETAALITEEGGEAIAWQANASDSQQVEGMIAACMQSFGAIDIIDNNVGIAPVGGVVELTEEDWDHAFSVNLKSCFLTMKFAIPIMELQGGGAIVNISSIASITYTGVPYSAYYSSKAAMNHLTRTTAVEYASRNIRVNAVLPGLMKTPMVAGSAQLASSYSSGDVEEMWKKRDSQCPMGHMGDAWDVAYAALFLASDESRYVSGITLVVDGAMSLKCV
jgi:NAD(P)-dependent dehydrogenase (short-subunit alcohol dehydrogenase family)